MAGWFLVGLVPPPVPFPSRLNTCLTVSPFWMTLSLSRALLLICSQRLSREIRFISGRSGFVLRGTGLVCSSNSALAWFALASAMICFLITALVSVLPGHLAFVSEVHLGLGPAAADLPTGCASHCRPTRAIRRTSHVTCTWNCWAHGDLRQLSTTYITIGAVIHPGLDLTSCLCFSGLHNSMRSSVPLLFCSN